MCLCLHSLKLHSLYSLLTFFTKAANGPVSGVASTLGRLPLEALFISTPFGTTAAVSVCTATLLELSCQMCLKPLN